MKKFSVLLATNSVKAYQYLAPEDLNIKKGMIVKVPFRSRELFGVVWDDNDESLEESKLKKIIKHYPQFIFSESRIKFIKFLSNYNYSNLGSTNWYNFAIKIIDYLNLDCEIIGISDRNLKLKAIRPKYSITSKNKIIHTFKLNIPHWEKSLKNYLIKYYS